MGQRKRSVKRRSELKRLRSLNDGRRVVGGSVWGREIELYYVTTVPATNRVPQGAASRTSCRPEILPSE